MPRQSPAQSSTVIDEFTTSRLVARRICEDDFGALLALHQNPQVMAWITADGGTLGEEQTRRFLERQLEHWRQYGFGVWMFRSKSDGRLVGRAGWRCVEIEGKPDVELGYAIDSAWWGQGLATELGQALVRLAWNDLGLDQVVTYTLPHNVRSRRVMEKLGFVYERDFVHAGLPHVLYRLTRAMSTSSIPVAPFGYLTCAQARAIDRRAADCGLNTLTLMENAGRGAAATLLALGIRGPVVLCCGKGNNGGDGLVMARHLQLAEMDVKVILFGDPGSLSPDAAANWRIVQSAGIDTEVWPHGDEARLLVELARADWAVDALYGTGLKGAVRPPLDRVIAALNAGPARIFAVDIPSGLDGDTGAPRDVAVRAQHTATFVAPKLGFANPAAAPWLGKVHVIDIGAPPALLTSVVHQP